MKTTRTITSTIPRMARAGWAMLLVLAPLAAFAATPAHAYAGYVAYPS